MKKKRSTPSKIGKSRDRSPQSGDEIISARDRFKGALQNLLPHSDEESDLSDDELWASKTKRLATNKKQRVDKPTSADDCNKYVMKLYDRSVDLAQFAETTPLYPICRAWIQNSPNLIYSIKREDLNESRGSDDSSYALPTSGDDTDAVRDTHHLPPPLATPVSRIPPIVTYETDFPNVPKENEEAPSREDILHDNLRHWRKVRKSWLEAAASNEARYEKSIRVLTAIYNKAQKQFQN